MSSPLHLLQRPRRLRSNPALRAMVQETRLARENFILPLFVSEKVTGRIPVKSMPGVFQLSETECVTEAKAAFDAGITAILLFGIPAHKDTVASQAYAPNGIVQRTVRAIKSAVPQLLVITDVCLCEFMSHGHCGITHFHEHHVHIENDASLELLAQTALSHAQSGADIVAPSDMMDGRIHAIRSLLDSNGLIHTPIMSYAAKFASAFYGPFRDAAESTPQAGDRRSYQMDPANSDEALREVALDIEQGADIVMVKPGLAYLDILWRIKQKFALPTAAYHVSGEYAMLKAAAANGWLDEKGCLLESMLAFRRAGADLIITYAAKDILQWLS